MRENEIDKLKEYKYGFTTDIENIKSPKGTTEAGINSLENNSFDKIIYEAIESAVERSIEISKAMENE